MVLVTHALPNEEPSRKIMLGENIWFILEDQGLSPVIHGYDIEHC